ncbi:MAG: hypothetical protein ACK5W1_05480 [Flavobacteriales bacterium]
MFSLSVLSASPGSIAITRISTSLEGPVLSIEVSAEAMALID